MPRIRKSLTAAAGAALTAALAVLTEAGQLDNDTVSQALGAALVAAATVGYATWRVPNQAAA